VAATNDPAARINLAMPHCREAEFQFHDIGAIAGSLRASATLIHRLLKVVLRLARAALQLEIIALRHQLGMLQRSVKRPKLNRFDRCLWACFCGVWAEWRDGIFGADFTKEDGHMGIEEVLSAPRSPWQRAYIERVVGSIRRECIDHVIIFNEESLRRHMKSYVQYYHDTRTHLSLEKDTPASRSVQPPDFGQVVALPQVGGLRHRYERRAA
jgi:hypothetical protein